jgi:coenzyme Q-binding protein COQ10
MPQHAERRLLPYSAEQVFDLVADVERYPEFLPWCLAARVKRREDNVVWAELVIGFKMVRERYTSRIALERPRRLDVGYEQGPFRHLANHWSFEPAPGGGCHVDFFIDFEFSSRLSNRIIGPLFDEASRRMIAAFEARARRLYGTAAKAG